MSTKQGTEMPFALDDMLVVGVASSALFDLSDSDKIFREYGEDEYRKHQEEHLDDTLLPGVAFPFIRRLLSLNDLRPGGGQLVEVIILSRNDPETGLRVMQSLEAHDLAISRAIFMQGRSSHEYMEALNMSLFLSANDDDVRAAIDRGLPAGRVVGTPAEDPTGTDLRIAFDFDGVLTDDSSERIMQASDLAAFHENEASHTDEAMPEGLMARFLRGINRIQDIEEDLVGTDPTYNRRVHVAIVTARNAPAHERVVRTLQGWGLRVNDAFFLGGVEKARILRVLRPHIFFDDQVDHLRGAANEVPSVHVPFGIVNAAKGTPPDVAADTEELVNREPQDQP
ncbi:5'-nucleotidase [Curtobacterium flaccumfaciens]|uniref:5'-nucleotidase n=1 Tax=Curtobacterium flaccumfaciens TaxID=2035 RepID=UPI001E28EA3E|nr:5'-nucleotidase [Curtobacterium allii]MCE0456927.1 5'-nucleotidase [Curtobacterium allii]